MLIEHPISHVGAQRRRFQSAPCHRLIELWEDDIHLFGLLEENNSWVIRGEILCVLSRHEGKTIDDYGGG
jgi:hypothetical protein